ncbi:MULTISPECIES: DUF6678 family protein [unclassified Bradyrhizobium]|nr:MULTISPECIES: DUF6678 family protein [unclassified Bradyrhizobium]
MNNTKWREFRTALLEIESATTYRTMSTNGYYAPPDADWFYHFQEGGYDDIRYVDIFATDKSHRQKIRSALKKIHLQRTMVSGCMDTFRPGSPSTICSYRRVGKAPLSVARAHNQSLY